MAILTENILVLSSPTPQQYIHMLNMAKGPGKGIENKIIFILSVSDKYITFKISTWIIS